MNIPSIMKDETLMIKVLIAVSAIILAGVLIGLGRYGIDLSSVFLGPAKGAHEPSRGIMAIEGALVAVTLLLGGIFIGGIMSLVKK